MGLVGFGDGIDREARGVRCDIQGNVPSLDIIVLDQVHGKSGLTKVNQDDVVGSQPLEVRS